MSELFADAFYFVALLSPKDVAHEKATRVVEHRDTQLTTTTWVIAEVAAYLAHPPARQRVVDLFRELQSGSAFHLIQVDAELYERGFDLYAARNDKAWSLTDCVSFLVREDRNIREALTADRHFEQAGFVALLK